MKKIIFLLALVATMLLTSVTPAISQVFWLNSQYGKHTDTLTNTTSKTLTTATNALNTASPYGGYVLQVNFTNLTGTTGTDTLILQSSLDGVLYSNHFKCAGTNGIFCDTLITGAIGTAGATYQHIWQLYNEAGYSYTLGANAATAGVVRQNNSGRRLYFRIISKPSGTHTTKLEAKGIIQN